MKPIKKPSIKQKLYTIVDDYNQQVLCHYNKETHCAIWESISSLGFTLLAQHDCVTFNNIEEANKLISQITVNSILNDTPDETLDFNVVELKPAYILIY